MHHHEEVQPARGHGAADGPGRYLEVGKWMLLLNWGGVKQSRFSQPSPWDSILSDCLCSYYAVDDNTPPGDWEKAGEAPQGEFPDCASISSGDLGAIELRQQRAN